MMSVIMILALFWKSACISHITDSIKKTVNPHSKVKYLIIGNVLVSHDFY